MNKSESDINVSNKSKKPKKKENELSESNINVNIKRKKPKKKKNKLTYIEKALKSNKIYRRGIKVVVKDPADNPHCPHGPTLLLSRTIKDVEKNFYVCAALRERKFCPYRTTETGRPKKGAFWRQLEKDFRKGIDHKQMSLLLNEIKLLKPSDRIYCSTCVSFIKSADSEHKNHQLITGITDNQLMNPTEILPPFEIDKKEAQYWFSKSCVEDIVCILKSLNYRNVICIGAPRIHEYIRNSDSNMTSILLDFDKRFHSFFGPLEFCWYNLFNNHFILNDAKASFEQFLKTDNGNNMAIITDPPFGGRTEPIAFTFKQINETYQKLNNRTDDIPSFWIFPYFSEPHIRFADANFSMLDYKVEYENHYKFGIFASARKWGSPVRIFTTVDPRLIKLPDNGKYKYCAKCEKWVSVENEHCDICQECTSKNGRTYVHCSKCNRCVKPTFVHCQTCKICALPDHHCDGTRYKKPCIHCDSFWHVDKNCPNKLKMTKARRQQIKLKKEMAKKMKRAMKSKGAKSSQSGSELKETSNGSSQLS